MMYAPVATIGYYEELKQRQVTERALVSQCKASLNELQGRTSPAMFGEALAEVVEIIQGLGWNDTGLQNALAAMNRRLEAPDEQGDRQMYSELRNGG
jgi:hypothetical protein